MTGRTWPDYGGYAGYEDADDNPSLVRETVAQAERRHDVMGWPWPVSGDRTTRDYAGQPCKHCGQPVRGWVHTKTLLQRCRPEDSGQPYGLNAELFGQACRDHCAGSA